VLSERCIEYSAGDPWATHGASRLVSKPNPVRLRSGSMRIYVFVFDKAAGVLGFTSEETGANLPGAYGPWREEVVPGICVVATDDDPISDAVCRDGFYISIECTN
jgi:hypothetical protein